jgi:hypothetical protein
MLTLSPEDWDLIDNDSEMQKQMEIIKTRIENEFPTALGLKSNEENASESIKKVNETNLEKSKVAELFDQLSEGNIEAAEAILDIKPKPQEPESTDAFSRFTNRITREAFLKLHPEKAGELDDKVEFVYVLNRPAAYEAVSE